MLIYLMRHGKAENSNPGGDAKRRLTEEGRQQVVLVARALQKLGASFDIVYSSSYLRAWETAALVCDHACPDVQPQEHSVIPYGGSLHDLFAPLHLQDDIKQALFVGHMPTMGDWCGQLTSPSQPMAMSVGKSSVGCFALNDNLDPASSKPQWHYSAKELRNML